MGWFAIILGKPLDFSLLILLPALCFHAFVVVASYSLQNLITYQFHLLTIKFCSFNVSGYAKMNRLQVIIKRYGQLWYRSDLHLFGE